MKKTEVSIDWAACTLAEGTDVRSLIPQNSEVVISNRLGYDRAVKLSSGIMLLSSTTRLDMGIHVIAGATALAHQQGDYGISAYDHVVNMVTHGGKFSRLDLCVDVYDSTLRIDDLVSRYNAGAVTTKARTGSIIKNLGEAGQTFYIGRRGSRKLLRIYDKGAQLNLDINWLRIEIELRKDAAREVASWLVGAGIEWPKLVLPIIKGFVHFPSSPIWCKIIGEKEIAIATPEPTESATRKWLINVCAPSIARLFCEGDERILRDVLQAASDKIRELKSSDNTDNQSGKLSN